VAVQRDKNSETIDRGFTRDLLLVLCMNRDARHHIKSLNPHIERILVEHSLDTDGLETVFGMIVMRLGYKSVSAVAAVECWLFG